MGKRAGTAQLRRRKEKYVKLWDETKKRQSAARTLRAAVMNETELTQRGWCGKKKRNVLDVGETRAEEGGVPISETKKPNRVKIEARKTQERSPPKREEERLCGFRGSI